MRPSVYIADLRYNYSGVLANDCMPLGVAYIKAVMDRDLPDVQSRLFAYPDHLWTCINDAPPDVLMVSNYLWNEELSFHLSQLAKRRKPGTLTVMGGPNIAIERDRQIAYMEAHPEIDVYILGEGDFLATEIVRAYLDVGMSIPKLGEMELPSSIYRRPDGTLAHQPMRNRHRDLDEIPSPWLTGIQDEFFDGKLAPMIETNRGCPFSCTFCAQGTNWYTKVHNFSQGRMREEIDYIAQRIRDRSPSMGTLRIADSNYGMFERDIEISEYIGEAQKKYGWPTFIDATTGKNRPDRIIKSLEKVGGALVLYQAVQSLNEDVLRNVKRQNIKLEAYAQLQVHMRGRGLRSNSDLILALPGETLQTNLEAVRKLVDSGINQMHNLQLVLLKGSELETLESRRMFAFDSRFRVLPKNFGIYGDTKVFDVEEVVVATDTLSFDDYLHARKYALAISVFWNDSWFEDLVQFAERSGVKRSEWLDAMVCAMDVPGPVRAFTDNFIRETTHELFPTREACVEFYSQDDNFARLLDGDIGDNLMYKYRAIASFHIWQDICRAAAEVTRRLVTERGVQLPEDFWQSLDTYVEQQHAHGHTAEEILGSTKTVLQYEIGRWLQDSTPLDIELYKCDPPLNVEFALTDEGRRGLEAALQVWTTSLKGLTKMVTRVRAAWQVRQCIPARLDVNATQPDPGVVAAQPDFLAEQW